MKNYTQLPTNMTEYHNSLIEAAELGAMKALEVVGAMKPFISMSEAKRLYGAKIVNRWAKEGLITVIKDGPGTSKTRISRVEIEAVSKSANRSSYLTIDERNNN